jgi:hypothetical protein
VEKLSMADVNIASLNLNLENASGHEHRIGPIVNWAAALFAERLNQRLRRAASVDISENIDTVTGTPANFDLRIMSNEHAAGAIASAWLEALTLKLKL